MKALPKDVMNQILEELRPIKQQPGDVTVAEAMEEWDISRTAARDILEKGIKDGELEKVTGIRVEGRRGVFYRRVEK